MAKVRTSRVRERKLGEALSATRVSLTVAVLGFVLAVVGTFGPWVNLLGVDVTGARRDDGKAVVALAAVALIALVWTNGARPGGLFAGVAALAVGVIAGYDSIHLTSGGSALLSRSIAWGLYVVLAGAVVAIVGLAESASDRRARWGISALAIACGLGLAIAAAS